MKAKNPSATQRIPYLYFSLGKNSRDIHSGREPDGTRVQSKSAAFTVVFSSEHQETRCNLQFHSLIPFYANTHLDLRQSTL